MRRDDLLPLKSVTVALSVSRTTLWRALRSDIPDMPAPLIMGRRVYFRRADLKRLQLALEGYEGRRIFEVQRARARQKSPAVVCLAPVGNTKAARERRHCCRARQASTDAPDGPHQPDLFFSRGIDEDSARVASQGYEFHGVTHQDNETGHSGWGRSFRHQDGDGTDVAAYGGEGNEENQEK